MQLDIRLPIGLMFAVMGSILAVYGILSNKAMYATHSLGINVNLWWGLAMLAFGIVMFILGRRGTSAVRPADETPEGRKMEAREKAAGLEGKRRGH
jgi:hypothetical protein